MNNLYSVTLGELILRHSDNLSRTFQKSTISAAEGQCVADMTVRTLQSIRNDSNFDLFWEKTTQDANKAGTTEPSLPRRKELRGELMIVMKTAVHIPPLLKNTTGGFTMKH